jgi:hypothetical protein
MEKIPKKGMEETSKLSKLRSLDNFESIIKWG